MRIVKVKPWWWFLIEAFYGIKWGQALFTWGDTIYTYRIMTPGEIFHEMTHIRQQRMSKLYGFCCLVRYAVDKKYRKKCELEAFRVEYQATGELQSVQHRMKHKLYGFTVQEIQQVCE